MHQLDASINKLKHLFKTYWFTSNIHRVAAENFIKKYQKIDNKPNKHNKIQNLPKFNEFSSISHHSDESKIENIKQTKEWLQDNLVHNPSLKYCVKDAKNWANGQLDMISSIAVSEEESDSHLYSAIEKHPQKESLKQKECQPQKVQELSSSEEKSEYNEVTIENLMFSSRLLNDFSLCRQRKTRKEILSEISFETEVHNIYNPEYSSTDSDWHSESKISEDELYKVFETHISDSPEISIIEDKSSVIIDSKIESSCLKVPFLK